MLFLYFGQLKNDTAFPKPAMSRYRVGQLTGMGVLLAEGRFVDSSF